MFYKKNKQAFNVTVENRWIVFALGYVISPEDNLDILTKKAINVFSTDRLNTGLLLFLLHTIHLMLIWSILVGLHLELFCTRK